MSETHARSVPEGSLNPSALTVAQLARLLGVAEEKVRKHVADGAPVAADGSINLVHYTAWLLKQSVVRSPESGGATTGARATDSDRYRLQTPD